MRTSYQKDAHFGALAAPGQLLRSSNEYLQLCWFQWKSDTKLYRVSPPVLYLERQAKKENTRKKLNEKRQIILV